jgi:predicted DNA binding CopG/RHH family protein
MEDLDFIKHLENRDFKSVSKKKLKEFKIQSKQIAKNTIARKTRKKALNIRLIEEDITKIKAIALRE